MATLKSNLKEALGWIWTFAMACIIVVLTVCTWGVQFAGISAVLHAFWPGLGKARWPVALIVGTVMTLLMVLGASEAKNLIQEDREKQRDLRWKAKHAKWSSSLRRLRQNNITASELEMAYWDGTDLLEEFAAARKNQEFRQSLDAVAAELKEKGVDVGHDNRNSRSPTH
jgi:hypothetical protein